MTSELYKKYDINKELKSAKLKYFEIMLFICYEMLILGIGLRIYIGLFSHEIIILGKGVLID